MGLSFELLAKGYPRDSQNMQLIAMPVGYSDMDDTVPVAKVTVYFRNRPRRPQSGS